MHTVSDSEKDSLTGALELNGVFEVLVFGIVLQYFVQKCERLSLSQSFALHSDRNSDF